MSLPSVVFLAPAGVCVLSWLGAGIVLPERWLPAERLLAWLTRLAAGSTVFALGAFLAGRAGAFDRTILLVATLVLAVPGAVASRRLARDVVLPAGRAPRILLALVALALVLDLVAATAPATSADSLKYHLALPELWLDRGRIEDTFWRYEGFSPFALEMLYAQGLSLGGDEVAGALGAVFAVASALVVYGLARALAGGDALAAAAAAALFTLQGLVTWEATGSFVDLGTSFYAPLAVWYALAHARRHGVLGGLAAGCAAGVKYVGLLAGALAAVPLAALLALQRRWRTLALAVAVGVAVASPWYLKNLVVTGNPFYPLLFGGKGWDQLAEDEVQGLADYGVGGPLVRLALLPVDLLVHGGEFDRGEYVGTAIFLLAPLALLRRPRLPVALLLGGALAFLVVWWELSPQARFLMPALAVLAAAAGVGASELARRSRRLRVALLVLAAVVVAAWAVSSAALTRKLVPVVVGLESRPEFLQRLTGTYDALQLAARHVDGVAAIAGYLQIYHYPKEAIEVGQPEFGPDLSRAQLLERLRAQGVTHVIVGRGEPGAILPLQGCVRQVALYDAYIVPSRTLGGRYPYRFIVYAPTCGPYARRQ